MLINELEDHVSAHSEMEKEYKYTNTGYWAKGVKEEAEKIIPKMKLLLSDKHTEAITEEAHSANTMLGEVCPCCKRPTSESYRASSSETPSVRPGV